MRIEDVCFLPGWLERPFLEVWYSLGNRARRLILERLDYVTGERTPELPDDVAGCALYLDGDIAIFLHADYLARRSVAVVKYTCAHELAHVILGHLETEPPDDVAEPAADRCAAKWGYPRPEGEIIPMGHSETEAHLRAAHRDRLATAITCIERSAAALARQYGLDKPLTVIAQHEPPANDFLKSVYLAEDVGYFLAHLAHAAAGVDVEAQMWAEARQAENLKAQKYKRRRPQGPQSGAMDADTPAA